MTSKSPDSPMISGADTRAGRIRGDMATKTRDAFHSWSLSSVGLEMGIAVVIGLLFGWWLDGKWGTDPWLMIAGTAVGMAAGLKGIFRALREADAIAARNERAAAEEAAKR